MNQWSGSKDEQSHGAMKFARVWYLASNGLAIDVSRDSTPTASAGLFEHCIAEHPASASRGSIAYYRLSLSLGRADDVGRISLVGNGAPDNVGSPVSGCSRSYHPHYGRIQSSQKEVSSIQSIVNTQQDLRSRHSRFLPYTNRYITLQSH